MDYTTYIVDAQTLVDNIHSIKQWVYSGTIRVHIPISCEYYVLSTFCGPFAPAKGAGRQRTLVVPLRCKGGDHCLVCRKQNPHAIEL